MSFWDQLLDELESLGQTLVEWTILIGVALLVLIIGRWILKIVRNILQRVLGADMLNGVWERSGVNRALAGSDQTAASITATVVYAYLMVGLVLVAVRILNLDTIEDLLERLLAWIPLLIVAAITVIIAAAAANWTADLIRPFATDRGVGWLALVAQVAIIIFGILFALELLNIGFAEDIVKLVVAAGGVALAIAFGVGGIDAAKEWWAKYGTPSASARMNKGPSSGE
ncbi:MAG: hypothetical protein IIC70_07665 [Acidobacteria bacterium]|nr:hypothetical protein [Acidobacteriota bacterium]